MLVGEEGGPYCNLRRTNSQSYVLYNYVNISDHIRASSLEVRCLTEMNRILTTRFVSNVPSFNSFILDSNAKMKLNREILNVKWLGAFSV